MKQALIILGVLLSVAMVALLILGVWTQDGRFGCTALVLFVPAVAVFMVASFVVHTGRCSGC